jgi:anti-anti-sigma factor
MNSSFKLARFYMDRLYNSQGVFWRRSFLGPQQRGRGAMSLQLDEVVVEVRHWDGLIVVTLAGAILDESNSPDVKTQILLLADGLAERRLYLDLSKVQVLSAAALRTLLALRKSLAKVGCELILVNLTAAVVTVFQATRLDKVFDIRRLPGGMPIAGAKSEPEAQA